MDPFTIILIILAFGMIWMTTRQRKTQREAQAFVESLAPGTEVMTMSGYVGTVVEVTDTHVVLESVPGGGTTTWVKAAVRKSVAPAPVAEDAADAEDIEAVEIPDNVAKLIGEDTSDIDKLTKPENDKGDDKK